MNPTGHLRIGEKLLTNATDPKHVIDARQQSAAAQLAMAHFAAAELRLRMESGR